jgi:conjugal transfer pilus assembly protein TraB
MMSDAKKDAGLGLFINKKTPKPGLAGGAAMAGSVIPKNVHKRWVYIGVGVVGVVVISSSLFSGQNQNMSSGPVKSSSMINVEPANTDKRAFESQFSQRIEALAANQERLTADGIRKDRQIAELIAGNKVSSQMTMPEGIVAPPLAPGMNTGGLASVGISSPPAPPIPPVRAGNSDGASLPPLVGTLPSLSGQNSGMQMPSMGNSQPLVFEAPATSRSIAATAAKNTPVNAKFMVNKSAGSLPAGAFASVALLNGVDAGTSTATQSNPMPLLFNITDQATLPGSAKYKLKNCFVLGTAYGDMSAERVYGRVSRLSCVDKSDRLVLSQEVQGYLVDSDGKLGLRGVVSDRQGAKLGHALLAGFAQGLSGALGQAQGSVLQNATTGTTTSSIGGSAAVRSAGLSGAQSAAGQLADFYLKEASNLFPVITVDAGRTGTIVFTNSVTLSWADADNQYVQQVTPTN